MLENTRQNIIDAAIFIFNEDLSAPLEKVADKASVTRRTLHRYFSDREDLLRNCRQEMQKSCGRSMSAAYQYSDDPLIQLEQLVYAGVDCGVKYAFLHKLHHLHGHEHIHADSECARYDETFEGMRKIIRALHIKGIISKGLTTEWISVFFPAVVNATVNLHTSGSVALNDLRKFAWYSFSSGIGI